MAFIENFCFYPWIKMENLEGQILNEYYLMEALGKGAFGAVYKAMNVLNGEIYAVKIMVPTEKNAQSYVAEVAAHEELSQFANCSEYVLCLFNNGFYNPKVIPENQTAIEEAISDPRFPVLGRVRDRLFFIVSELMDGDLKSLIKMINDSNMTVDPQAYAYIILQFLRGLRYIHERYMAHRDIKPENILYKIQSPIDEPVSLMDCLRDPVVAAVNMKIKFGDLGFTCTDENHEHLFGEENDVDICRTAVGSPLFLSPELWKLLKERIRNVNLFIAKSSDIWALAITIWEFVFYKRPPMLEPIKTRKMLERVLINLTQTDIDNMISTSTPTNIIDPDIANAIMALLHGMFTINVDKRLTALEGAEMIEAVI